MGFQRRLPSAVLAVLLGLAGAALAPAQDTSAVARDTLAEQADTLSLPDKTARTAHGRYSDSVSKEFRKYWAELEKREGIDALRAQVQAHNNVDRTWVPRLYLFDSSVVVFPGWVIFRKKDKRKRH